MARHPSRTAGSARGLVSLLPPTSLSLAGVSVGADRFRRDGTLTRREAEVLELVAAGASSAEIAAQLAIAQSTVESHVKSARRKFGASSRIGAVHASQRVAAAERSGASQPALDAELHEVLSLVAAGATVADVARRTNQSPRRVKRRLAAARAALGARTTSEAIRQISVSG